VKARHLLLFLILAASSLQLSAQDIYRTRHGDIAISMGYGDTTLLLVSNELVVTLDYETSKVNFYVPYSTFRTGIDTIDARLRALRDTALEFYGKLGIAINTKNISEQHYNMEGTLVSGSFLLPIQAIGSMTCLASADRITPACTLLMTMETTLRALRLAHIFPTARNGVRIDLRESILEREP
jgi:hypothetical protein